jgi:hypothetical protein
MNFNKIIDGNKLPVLFIGSGFSRRYLNSPTWDKLLTIVYQKMGKTEFDFTALKSRVSNKSENRGLTDGEINAIVAEEIEREFNDYFYESDLIKKFPEWVKEGYNPFRKCVSDIVSDLDILEDKVEEINAFKSLKNKIMAIITTNYDLLIENLFSLPKESIFIGQPQLFNPRSVEVNELYKIHGCITDPNNIVITRKDYNTFKETAKLFSAKLLTLISENPVIFIGYSINDPNIQQTLSDLVRCLSKEQIEDLKNHFYLIEYNDGEQNLIEKQYLFHAKSYTGEETVFPITVISTDNYLEIYNQLSLLTPAMNLNTVRQVKRILKDIVVQSVESNPESDEVITIFMDDISKLKQNHEKFAIAIGNIKDINSAYGYSLRPIEDILEDVLFNNKNLNNKRLIKDTYEKSYLKIKRILPIYKYLVDFTKEELNDCPKVSTYIKEHRRLEDYLNSNIIKSLRNVPEGNSLEQMPKFGNFYNKFIWIIKNINNLDLEEIKVFLQSTFHEYAAFNNNQKSDFRRLVSIYDLYAFKK